MNEITCALVLLTMVLLTSIASDVIRESCSSTMREQQMRMGVNHQFHPGPIQDHVLIGKVYRNQTARAYVTCAVFCLHEDACKSFNYCKDSKLCQLNSAVYSENKTALQPSSGCFYFDEEVHEGKIFRQKKERNGMKGIANSLLTFLIMQLRIPLWLVQ